MKNRKAALGFMFFTVLIDIIGLGIIIPVMPNLITELTGESLSQASRYGGLLMFVYAIMQFLFAPILGGISDRFGRRKVLLFSLFGMGVDYLVLAFAPSISWLFFGRLIAGICGASYTTASAYIADVSTPENRAQNFGMIGAAFGLGFIIGPVLGGFLGEIGSRIPFFAASGMALLNWLYGYFVVPESLPANQRRAFSWKRANPVGTIMYLKRYPVIIGLVGSLFLIYLSAHATQGTWSYYTMERYGWSNKQVGISLGFVGLFVAMVQGLLIKRAVKIFGQVNCVYLGLMFSAVGMLTIGLASFGWMVYFALLPYALGGLAGPSLQGIMAGQVPSNQQGELQGGLTSLISITSIIGPVMMTTIFAHFTSDASNFYLPGAPFYLACFLLLISLVLAYRSLRKTVLVS